MGWVSPAARPAGREADSAARTVGVPAQVSPQQKSRRRPRLTHGASLYWLAIGRNCRHRFYSCWLRAGHMSRFWGMTLNDESNWLGLGIRLHAALWGTPVRGRIGYHRLPSVTIGYRLVTEGYRRLSKVTGDDRNLTARLPIGIFYLDLLGFTWKNVESVPRSGTLLAKPE